MAIVKPSSVLTASDAAFPQLMLLLNVAPRHSVIVFLPDIQPVASAATFSNVTGTNTFSVCSALTNVFAWQTQRIDYYAPILWTFSGYSDAKRGLWLM